MHDFSGLPSTYSIGDRSARREDGAGRGRYVVDYQLTVRKNTLYTNQERPGIAEPIPILA